MGEYLPWPITAIFAVITGSSLLIAELSTWNPSGNGQQVLTTLASIQAAVFAIVFSVIILGIQLSTSRYSTRLADLFRTDIVYKKTVGVFATSLAVDVAVLTAFNHLTPYLLRFSLSYAIGLATASFFLLYFFVDRTLEQTTPEGIIKRVKQELTPSQIISDAESADNDSSETDPFLVPVSIIRSAINDRDVPAATQGLNVIDEQVGRLLKHVSTDQLREDKSVGDSVEELCKNRLHNAGEKAVEEDLDEVGTETVSTISSIGCNAVDQQHEPVAVHSSQGLSKLVGTVGFDTVSEKTRQKAVDDAGEMLKEAADAQLWDTAGTGIRLLGWRAAQSVIRRDPTAIHKLPYGSLSMNYIPDVFEQVVEAGSDNVDEDNLFNTVRRDGDNTSAVEWALWSCYASLTEVTSAFIRFEIEHGEEIVDWTFVGAGWRDCLSALTESSFNLILQQWLATLLYLEYIEFEVESGMMSGFRSVAQYDVSRELMKDTIDKILDGDLKPQNHVDRLPGRGNPVERPRSGVSVAPVSDPGYEFNDWLRQVRGRYLDITEGEGKFAQVSVESEGSDS
ncbi:DUF2254 domain-containing protein [Halonotius terrestris]|uniref:DUF2254 domain-containing protein n=1 Tax=Halonotius terrestris TaxID=2487750 RepID=A0A8J8PAA5_9EURY|nr:DUF2254 family protein [Halonotius terrestris]TQQ79191.1 DUF2254 domain-containing protein [Halonotius terrestris]